MWAEKDGIELKIAKETQKLNWYVPQPISAVHSVLVHVVAPLLIQACPFVADCSASLDGAETDFA